MKEKTNKRDGEKIVGGMGMGIQPFPTGLASSEGWQEVECMT